MSYNHRIKNLNINKIHLPCSKMSLEQSTNSKNTLIDFCNQHQIPYFYLTIKYITTADGKMKKQISRLPKGYMEMTYTQAMALHKPIAATHINIILKN